MLQSGLFLIQQAVIFVPNDRSVNCEANTWCSWCRGRQLCCSTLLVLQSGVIKFSVCKDVRANSRTLGPWSRLLLLLQRDQHAAFISFP